MSNEAKIIFEATYLAFGQATWEICQATPADVRCTNGMELRAIAESRRASDDYYNLEQTLREAWDEGMEEMLAEAVYDLSAASIGQW